MSRLLNVIWPAIYVHQTYWKFWYLILVTIFIEFIALQLTLGFSWKKAFSASLIGNLVSGLAGTPLLMFGMIGWHAIADPFLQGTFSYVNWAITYLFMCLGSVLIETTTVSLVYSINVKKLFPPMLIGNLLTYIIIAFFVTVSDKEDEFVRKERVLFISDKEKFTLLDNTNLTIDTAYIETWYNKSNVRIDNANPSYRLQIPFHQNKHDAHNIWFNILEEGKSSGIANNAQQIFVDSIKESYQIVMEQKNPNPDIGWKEPIHRDSFKLIRINRH